MHVCGSGLTGAATTMTSPLLAACRPDSIGGLDFALAAWLLALVPLVASNFMLLGLHQGVAVNATA